MMSTLRRTQEEDADNEPYPLKRGRRKSTASQHRLAVVVKKLTHMSPLLTRDDYPDHK